MNPITNSSNANSSNTNLNNTNANNIVSTNRIVKEDTSMNTNALARSANSLSRFARRSAASLLALGGLLALSHAAHADIVVDKFVGPQQVYSYDYGQLVASAGTTDLQLKLRNTDNTTVSGITVQTYVYLASDVNNGWTVRAMPALTNQTLGPNQSKWVTLAIPKMALQGFSLYNRMLSAKAIVDNKNVYWVQNALDRPADSVQPGNPQHTSGSATFSLTFTNNGSQNAPAKSVSLRATPSDSNGSVVAQSSVVTQTFALPALEVGQSATLTFALPAQTNGAEFCALDIQIADPLLGYSSDNSAQVYY